MLQNDYNTKIVNVNWRHEIIEIEITTTIYDSDSRLWNEIKTVS